MKWWEAALPVGAFMGVLYYTYRQSSNTDAAVNEYGDAQGDLAPIGPDTDDVGQEGVMLLNGQQISTTFPVRMRSGLSVKARSQLPVCFVIHHSVTSSANSTYNVLKARGLSTHFEVDQDGSISQYADPWANEAFHSLHDNPYSIGIDLTGPVGDAGFTAVQLDTLAVLIRFLADYFSIPLTTEDWGAHVDPGVPGVYAHAQVQWSGADAKIDPSWPYNSAGVWDQIRSRLATA